MLVFISGGAKNGKSYLAQRIAKKLAGNGKLYYTATMDPRDEEDEERIKRHISEREGWGFETLECPYCEDLRGGEGSYLFDSVTAILSNEMFRDGKIDETAPERVKAALLEFADRCENIVMVSDYIYSDAVLYDEFTEAYRRALADCDIAIAAKSGCVIEVCSSNITFHRGGWDLIEKA